MIWMVPAAPRFALNILDGDLRILVHNQVSSGPLLRLLHFHELEDMAGQYTECPWDSFQGL